MLPKDAYHASIEECLCETGTCVISFRLVLTYGFIQNIFMLIDVTEEFSDVDLLL